MERKNVTLAIPSHCNRKHLLSQGRSQPWWQSKRMAWLTATYNPVYLSAWRANVDMHYIVSRWRVIGLCVKYVTKIEPRSQSLREIFTTIVCSLNNGNNAVQKLLINGVGERYYSTQEMCSNCRCLKPHVTSLFSILMDLMQLKIVWRNNSAPLLHQLSTVTWDIPALRRSVTWHSYTLLGITECPRHLGLILRIEARESLWLQDCRLYCSPYLTMNSIITVRWCSIRIFTD